MSGLLNERITALRKERGFTQEQLGQMVGVSAQAVSKWEKGGFPDVELLPAVAGALGANRRRRGGPPLAAHHAPVSEDGPAERTGLGRRFPDGRYPF